MCKVCDENRQSVIDFNVDDFIQSKLNEFPNMTGLLDEYRNTLLNLQSQAISSTNNKVDKIFEQTLKDIDVVIAAEEQGLTAEATAGLEEQPDDDPLAPSKLPSEFEVDWEAIKPLRYTPSRTTKMDDDAVARLFEQKETTEE